MLADRVRMRAINPSNGLVLYDKGKTLVDFGYTKLTGNSSIDFLDNYLHVYAESTSEYSNADITIAFKLPDNLPPNAQVLIKYFDSDYCNLGKVNSDFSKGEVNYWNSVGYVTPSYIVGTGETLVSLSDVSNVNAIGIFVSAYPMSTAELKLEKIEVVL